MEVQVLQEINSQVRKSPPSQGGEVASANTRLLGLKGNSVREPDFSAPSPQNTFPDQAQSQVEPEISSVARAASAYSKAIGDGLNPDELKAVQDLAIKVRSIVTEFLSQSGLEQAANADAVVSTNPEAVQIVTDNLGQTVKQALNLPNVDTDGNADSAVTNEEVPSDEVRSAFSDRKPQISIERITNGAQTAPAEIVTAAPPALQISQAQNAAVENPVNRNPVPEAIDLESDETVSGTPTAPEGEFIGISTGPELAVKPSEIVAASPALQNSQAQNAAVENPVNRNQNSGAAEPAGFVVTPESTEIPDGDFTGIATGRRLVNNPDQNTDNAVPQATSASQPVTRPAPESGTPVAAASPALQNAR
ncbi:MAG: hypothetical protein OEZ51_13110, partial [Nitrospinota bacterium]|nr:hypothetical protein [Nitrospinota bacterium]